MTHVLYNPLACNHRGEEKAHELDRLLDFKDAQYVDITTVNVPAFLKRVPYYDAVIIAGGDGTLNHVVNQLSDIQPEQQIYYYATGSGNDFMCDVKDKTVQGLIMINRYIESLPRVTVNGRSFRFVNGIGYGIDGYCCEEGDRLREMGREKINYASIAAKGLFFHFKPMTATITVDGSTQTFHHVWLAPTMNGRYYGGGMMVAPNQNRMNEDRTVSTVIMHCPSRLKTLAVFPSIFKGDHVKHKEMVTVLVGRAITVAFDRPTALQIDGETIPNVLQYCVSSSASIRSVPSRFRAAILREVVNMKNTKQRLQKKDFITIPNFMSLFRICLIPLIVWLYCDQQNYVAAVAMIALSALTDILDGKIARKFNMVSDIGKVLDPIADKLTQAALIICLVSQYKWALGLIILFIIREAIMGLLGYITLTETQCVNGAKWYGKATTALIYASMMILILFPDIPVDIANGVIAVCAAAIIIACALYCRFYRKILAGKLEPGYLKKNVRILLNAFLLCIWAVIIVLCICFRESLTAQKIASMTPANSFLAALVLLALFALKSLSVVIYAPLLYAVSGILFSFPIAIMVNVLGTVIMISIPFGVGNVAGSATAKKLVEKHPKLGVIQKIRTNNSFLFVWLARMIRLPSDLVSAYMGAVGICYATYLTASVLGMAPSMITFAMMGMNLHDIRSPKFIISAVVQIILMAASVVLYVVYQRRYQQRCAENPDETSQSV